MQTLDFFLSFFVVHIVCQYLQHNSCIFLAMTYVIGYAPFGVVAFTVYLHCSIPNSKLSEGEESKCLSGFLCYGVWLCSTVISKQRQCERANTWLLSFSLQWPFPELEQSDSKQTQERVSCCKECSPWHYLQEVVLLSVILSVSMPTQDTSFT